MKNLLAILEYDRVTGVRLKTSFGSNTVITPMQANENMHIKNEL